MKKVKDRDRDGDGGDGPWANTFFQCTKQSIQIV